MVTIGRNITHFMRERELTLPKLASKAGMDKGNLYRIVNTGKGYSSDSLERIATALGVTIAELFAESPNVDVVLAGMRMIPVLSERQVAAFADDALYFRENETQEYTMTSNAYSARAFAVRVQNEAMVPDFNPGDLAIVDPEVAPTAGKFVVALIDDGKHAEAVLKRYADRGLDQSGKTVFELIPSNSHYASWKSDVLPIRILGVACEKVVRLP